MSWIIESCTTFVLLINALLWHCSTIGSFPFFFVFEPYTGFYYLFQVRPGYGTLIIVMGCVLVQPGGKRDTVSKASITSFLRDINSGDEEVREHLLLCSWVQCQPFCFWCGERRRRREGGGGIGAVSECWHWLKLQDMKVLNSKKSESTW